jgi:carboxyl-terminal processing protease
MRTATSALVIAAMLLSACGGGGSGGGGTSAVALPTPTPSPTTTGTCALAQRQAFALTTLQEWYLFPQDLASGVNPASYTTVDDYIDALVAPARALGKDRFFTYITSIAEENAFFSSGSSAGFGVRLTYDTAARRVFIAEAFEGAPALTAGIDRGDEITAIGDTAATLRNVSDIIAAEGNGGVTNALGPSTAGVTRTLRMVGPSGTRTLTIAKADFNLPPVSSRYGVRIINDGAKQIGYINLRTFISSADQPLRDAFLSFRNAGITEFIIDVRYNGGGLVSTAELIGDLLGRNRGGNEVWSRTTFRPEKSSNNDTHFFNAGPNSVAPVKIAFIGTGSSASASELIINSSIPYLGANMALVGTNTFGKPVGQIAIDRAACDDRIRVVAFATGNSLGQSDYYNGLASKVPNSCRATDDVAFPLGDPREASVRTAIDFLAGRSCTRISDAGQGTAALGQRSLSTVEQQLMAPDAPTPAQREVPGLF